MIAVGTWLHFFWWGGIEDMRNVIWLPLRAHTDPLPMILPLLIQFSAAPLSPTAVLPPLVNLHILTKPDPDKEKNGVCFEGQT